MKLFVLFAGAALAATPLAAASPAQVERAVVERAVVEAAVDQAWVGERVPFFVELRAPGSFAGAASFELPRVPGSLLLKVGNPVVSSEQLAGDTWFVQRHEFALFSQSAGVLEVPPITVHFAHREGFVGPELEVDADTPTWSVELRRPPGSEALGFLVTTASFEVTETWDPEPGAAQVGALFRRTIVQRATGLSGMALAPAPQTAPAGFRIYPSDPETDDALARGQFLGERRDTLTYLLTEPGSHQLPALRYVWWNPDSEQLEQRVLPAATFEVAAAPQDAGAADTSDPGPRWLPASLAALAVLGAGLVALRAQRWKATARTAWSALHPPERVAARRIRAACARNDAAAAQAAWLAWRGLQDPAFDPGDALRAALSDLQRRRYGRTSGGDASSDAWRGAELAHAFRARAASERTRASRLTPSALPPLNPPG
jgi:hypothetical protein